MRLFPAPRSHTPWPARALAVVLAVLGPLTLALSARTPAGVRAAEQRDTMERVVALVPLLTAQPLSAEDASAPQGPRASAAPTVPTLFPTRSGGFPAPRSVGADSSGGAPDAAVARTPRAPTPRELFRSPAAGTPLCLPPCGDAGRTVAGADGTRAGAGIVFPPLDPARRDSIAQAVVAAAAAKGSAASSPGGSLPPGAVGVSIPVGLPGGGPTRAQRERARALDADVSARLARIRARGDSIAMARRRDSVARAMPRDAQPGDDVRTPG